ncbi:hypothetical protein IDH50_12770 [Aeromicrobium tamlense]|uniref:Uncharacterized protein n=1 Tax=Aeromicrobium tamlense TaxID=375541 RepID=A0A8I0FUY5_9ACTN|nr:hypothetical protein [Aeromicrobium tamlense]MBD1270758.1 hypothetical protein [Aeromicrobium tamlense]MBD1271110.1 hypothetical protein [Aeromicrobium tamlense]NYI38150.1 hypothetical protein [Aeromicrobium tamlense]
MDDNRARGYRRGRRILDGDDSAVAAAALEESLHAHHPYEENVEDLLELLSLYAPSMERPCADHRQLCICNSAISHSW